jgi:hypothetical protein
MVFFGSVPADMRSIVSEHTRSWTSPSIYVGCSGAFTIERILAPRGVPLHGNDVQLLSCALGGWFTDAVPEVELAAEYEASWGFIKPYLVDPADRVATVMLGTRAFRGAGRTSTYGERMREGYRQQWPQLHTKTVATVRAAKLRLAGYYAGDVLDFARAAPRDAAFACFPPFHGNSYEGDFKDLHKVLRWDQPAYELLDDDRMADLLNLIRDRRDWIVSSPERRPDLEPWLRGAFRTTNRGIPLYTYSSGSTARTVQPRQDLAPVLARRLVPGGRLPEHGKLRIHELRVEQFQALRSQYMNRGIVPGAPSLAFAVTVEGVLVGSFAYGLGPTMAHWEKHLPGPHSYLLSDFPVAPTDYRHLAKLVLYAATSDEVRWLIERYTNRRSYSIITTAYTNNPVSMKYRGIFDLLRRDEGTKHYNHGAGLSYYNQRFTLHYGRQWPGWDLEEGYRLWHSKRAQLQPSAA